MDAAIRGVGAGAAPSRGDMTMMKRMIPVGAVVMALSLAGAVADAGQRDSRGRDRNGRESRGEAQRDSGPREQAPPPQRQEAPRQAPRAEAQRESPRAEAPRAEANRGNRDQAVPRGDVRGDSRRDGGQDRGGRYEAPSGRDNRYDNRGGDRRDAYRYDRRDDGRYQSFRYAPMPRYYGNVRRPRYYGPGGNFSVYFGLGSGYLYGSPYSGRVYGYAAPRGYGSRIYYGDLRLQVRPRNAAVYVDGYYAGTVDDFDGVFQRLTLEVGPHEIELEAPGLAPQAFDVYIDPAQTVNLRTDLYPY
jgi:hypothetical protein